MSDPGLLAAMLAVQAKAPTLLKDNKATVRSDKGSYTYGYVALDTIVEKVRPLLVENDLVWTTKPSFIEGVGPSLKYKLAHAPSKESDEGEMLLLLPKNDPQGQGSAITYARRYALCAVLDLVVDKDDDGGKASGGQPRSYGSSTKPASDAQKRRLKGDITRNKLSAEEVDVLFRGVAFQRGEGEKVNDAIARLTAAQASTLIDTLAQGAVKTGESDVPADPGEFTHDPGDDREPVPFDPGVPS